MAVLNVNPTRMELTQMKRRLVTARRGHKLLKDKRDELVRQFMTLVKENLRLRQRGEGELSFALKDFALARAVMEPGALRQALLYPARQASVRTGRRNILSVRVPEFTVDEDSLGEARLPYGIAETSAQLDNAIATMAPAPPTLIAPSDTEQTAALLPHEIHMIPPPLTAL